MANPNRRQTWTTEATLDLFACLLKQQNPDQAVMRAMVDDMKALGHSCTIHSVHHQLRRIKQREAAATPGTNIPSTPKKPANAFNDTTPASKKRRRVKDEDGEAVDEDAAMLTSTPRKKRSYKGAPRVESHASAVKTGDAVKDDTLSTGSYVLPKPDAHEEEDDGAI